MFWNILCNIKKHISLYIAAAFLNYRSYKFIYNCATKSFNFHDDRSSVAANANGINGSINLATRFLERPLTAYIRICFLGRTGMQSRVIPKSLIKGNHPANPGIRYGRPYIRPSVGFKHGDMIGLPSLNCRSQVLENPDWNLDFSQPWINNFWRARDSECFLLKNETEGILPPVISWIFLRAGKY